jgi:hypothetical protein
MVVNFFIHTISLGHTILLKSKVVFVNDRMLSFKSSTKNQSGMYVQLYRMDIAQEAFY